MLFPAPTGVRASAAQNAPVNTICSQCGSVLASGVRECNFCEAPELPPKQQAAAQAAGNSYNESVDGEWRREMNQRLQSYRVRKRRPLADTRQSALPFDENAPVSRGQVALQEAASDASAATEDFAFTIAIGRTVQKETDDTQVLIDVSSPPETEMPESKGIGVEEKAPAAGAGLPVASLEERRRALLIDAACLAFAYGSFLALFGSLGGHFTLSKLSAAVCVSTFAFVYIQYFALFTIFGGSTPGMMLSDLQVASVTGDVPTARQYVLRAVGYLLSAGTCFLGFLWVMWDEEGLTWHDRISQTYLTGVDTFQEDASHAAAAR